MQLGVGGRATSIDLKIAHATGEARLAMERPGHTEGFQRMSFGISAQGKTNAVVQTAFDKNGDLVRQRPGQSKDNLYDVKYRR